MYRRILHSTAVCHLLLMKVRTAGLAAVTLLSDGSVGMGGLTEEEEVVAWVETAVVIDYSNCKYYLGLRLILVIPFMDPNMEYRHFKAR